MGKENVVYIHKGVLLGQTKGQNPAVYKEKMDGIYFIKAKLRKTRIMEHHICSIGKQRHNSTRRAVRQVKGDEGEARDVKGSQTGSL